MKFGGIGRQVFFVFLATVVGYIVVFSLIQRQRTDKGPWLITFVNESGIPSLTLNQTNLNLRDVKIVFAGQSAGTNVTQTMDFGTARGVPIAVPFGDCVFFDARFLPGTVVFHMFGHEIQLLPRVLTIDKVERPWKSGDIITLGPTNNAAPAAPPLKTQ
jgi:hypothetical protein